MLCHDPLRLRTCCVWLPSGVLQYFAVCCRLLQCVTVYCIAESYSVLCRAYSNMLHLFAFLLQCLLQCLAVCNIFLQRAALCCVVPQSVAVCCHVRIPICCVWLLSCVLQRIGCTCIWIQVCIYLYICAYWVCWAAIPWCFPSTCVSKCVSVCVYVFVYSWRCVWSAALRLSVHLARLSNCVSMCHNCAGRYMWTYMYEDICIYLYDIHVWRYMYISLWHHICLHTHVYISIMCVMRSDAIVCFLGIFVRLCVSVS